MKFQRLGRRHEVVYRNIILDVIREYHITEQNPSRFLFRGIVDNIVPHRPSVVNIVVNLFGLGMLVIHLSRAFPRLDHIRDPNPADQILLPVVILVIDDYGEAGWDLGFLFECLELDVKGEGLVPVWVQGSVLDLRVGLFPATSESDEDVRAARGICGRYISSDV